MDLRRLEFYTHYGRFATYLGIYELLKLLPQIAEGKISKQEALQIMGTKLVSPEAIAQYFAFQKIEGFAQKNLIQKILSEQGSNVGEVLAKKMLSQFAGMALTTVALSYGGGAVRRVWMNVNLEDGFSSEDLKAIGRALVDAFGDVNVVHTVLQSIGFTVGTTLASIVPGLGQTGFFPLMMGFVASDLMEMLARPIEKFIMASQMAFVSISIPSRTSPNRSLVSGKRTNHFGDNTWKS
jgi:hypothetical protein